MPACKAVRTLLLLGGWLAWWSGNCGEAADPPASPAAGKSATDPPPARFTVEKLAGKVVWLNETLRKRHQIQSVPEAAERVLALETADGTFYPLIEDVRGRAFRRDVRLRDIPVELLVRRYPEMPFVQVIGVFGLEKGQRVEIYYWCEVCAITMYELKECECCQGPIELRRRPAP